LIGMAEDGKVSISKVVGPSWTSSTTASTGFNTALEGVGAAVMGVGALLDSEPLVLGGLAMVAVSLYRQRHGVPQEQEGFDLRHGGDLLPGVEQLAEASEPQLNEKEKEEKSLKTTRLAKRPQKRHIHPIHKAEPARQKVQMKILVVMAHRALFLGMGE
jgi:hypothetical protein